MAENKKIEQCSAFVCIRLVHDGSKEASESFDDTGFCFNMCIHWKADFKLTFESEVKLLVIQCLW